MRRIEKMMFLALATFVVTGLPGMEKEKKKLPAVDIAFFKAVATKRLKKSDIDQYINAGAHINARVENGRTPLMNALLAQEFDNADLLLDVPGIDITIADDAGFTALHYASNENESVSSVLKLLKMGANANALSATRWTPLHVAANSGAGTVVKLLIRVPKINLVIKNSDGKMPAQLAYERSMSEKFERYPTIIENFRSIARLIQNKIENPRA